MKKGLLVTTLLAASTLLLASCEKTVSYDDAKKHVNDNFTTTDTVMFDIEVKTKVSESSGVFSATYKVGENTDKSSGKLGVIKAQALELYGDKATYKVDGTKLIIEQKTEVKDFLKEQGIDVSNLESFGGNVFSRVATDEKGYMANELYKIENLNFKVSSSLGLTVEGKLSMEVVTTYTARPAN